jgi:hypothetical protein
MIRSYHRKVVLEVVLAVWVGLAANVLQAGSQQDCTLEPRRGSKQSALSNGVTGTMTWSACIDMVHEFVFEWPRKRGFPTPQEALKRAAALLREWRRVTKIDLSPFADLATAIDRRAAQSAPYVFGESFAVTDIPGVPDWDGAWISVSSAAHNTKLTIHYWAKP